jgi:2-haloacid dehalogenase
MKPVAVVFDLFGTLLDIASLRDAAAQVAADPAAFVATWREKQIAYAFASAIMDAYEDFDAMTLHGLRYAAEKHSVRLDADAERHLVAAWARVRAYDDVVPALQALRDRGIPCAVLTNGTASTARAAIENAGIASFIDDVLSVDAVQVFKPDRRVYALVTQRYATSPPNLIFVSSNGWDATGAAAFGMRVAWCNRAGLPPETFGPPPTWTIGGFDAATWDPILAE